MPEITINDYSAGWLPGEDPIQGKKNGLLQMDNLDLDTNGALKLAGGTVVKHVGFASNAHTLASRIINGVRYDYTACIDGSVYRNSNFILGGGDTSNAAFGTAFNFVLIASGANRVKATGTTLVTLGVAAATTAPTVSYAQGFAPATRLGDVVSSLVAPIGAKAVIGSYVQMTADSNGTWALQTYAGVADPHNLNEMTGVDGNIGYATDDDFIYLTGYTPTVLGRALNLDILLVAGNGAGDIVTDYYTYQIGDLAATTFSAPTGIFSWKLRRKDFIRVGGGSQDWSTTYGFRISYSGGDPGEVVNILAGDTSGTFY